MRTLILVGFALFWLMAKSMTARAELTSKNLAPDKNRILRGQVSFDLYPLSNLIVPATGLSIGTHINNDHMIEFKYAKGSIGLDRVMASSRVPSRFKLANDSDIDGEINGVYEDIKKTQITHTQASIEHRYFWSSVFYTKHGVGVKKYGVEYPLEDISKYDDLSAVIEVTKPAASIGVGHRWIIKNFMLNMEWIDIVVPFDQIRRRNIDGEGSDFTKKYRKFTNQVLFRALNFSVGLVF